MSMQEKYKDHFFTLLEAGFIAVNQADEDSATKLFHAASILDKESNFPKIGIGYLHLHKLELKHACKLFNEVLEKEPNNEMAKTFLGICLSLTPDKVSEGEKILEETSKTSDKDVKKVANTALEFVEKFVKKPKPPTA